MNPIPVRCRIPEHLERIGQNQQWLAMEIEVSEPRISEICNLKNYNISIRRAKRISNVLKCSIDELFEWE